MAVLLKPPSLKEGRLVKATYPGQVLPLTFYALDNEPCYGMCELNLPAPGYHGFHRYRILMLARDDRLHEYREDLGPKEMFSVDELRILGGSEQPNGKFLIVHTVGEMREMALEWHAEYSVDKDKEPVQPHDFHRLLNDFQEAKRMIAKAHVSFMMKGAI